MGHLQDIFWKYKNPAKAKPQKNLQSIPNLCSSRKKKKKKKKNIIMNMNWSGGDWMCGVCEHVNFKKREACQRCGYPKYGATEDPTAYHDHHQYMNPKTDHDHHQLVLAGDWYCNCGAHNYASRSSCYRCNSYKTLPDLGALPAWKSGDWICSRIGCETHNYASRMECYKCKAPRDFGGSV